MSKSKPDRLSDEFYEAMPLAGAHHAYRDDKPTVSPEVTPETMRRTALITLILVALVAIAIGLLLARGLEIVRGTQSSTTTTSGSLEP